jgi:hypothetical protein
MFKGLDAAARLEEGVFDGVPVGVVADAAASLVV